MATVDIDNKIVERLLEVKKNQLKMVSRRGYDASRESFIHGMNVDKFTRTYVAHAQKINSTFRGAISNVYMNDAGDRIAVFYAEIPTTTQLGVNDVGDGIAYMRLNKAKNAIIITAKPLSQPAVKHVNGLIEYNIHIFLEQEMSYDPTAHFLVPKHIPLPDDVQREFLENNNLDIDNMPNIATDDIIARYYGLKPGRVVRIERENMFGSMIIKSLAFKVVKDVICK